ncbi:hypothetical protein [Phenylobacterium sp.]|uniref:hypothetical protein n=1 Tax=Phenylobacterium sp. TaxID=1871053 RepID=UPI003BAB3009
MRSILCVASLLRLRLGALAAALALASCGPLSPPKDGAEKGAAQAVSAPPAKVADVQQLSIMGLPAPLKWDLAEGVMAGLADGEGVASGSTALQISPTADASLHRVGFGGSYGPGAYRVTVWVKASPGVGVIIEGRGKTLVTPSRAADYGVALFDLESNASQPSPLVTDETRFPAAAIVQDGDWKKITTQLNTRDGWLIFTVGMTSKGQHVFAGESGMKLTIGGIEVAPR